jgi:ElaB/YqjD/DUF883 family membrane-anchored ribosome-binding protein
MEAQRKVSETAAGFDRTVDRVAAGAHDTVDKVAGAAAAAARMMEEKGGQYKEVQDRYLMQARDSVRENPWAAIGIAVAAGFLLNHLLTRR